MHKPEFLLKNATYKILWDFEMQTDHLITARRPDLVIANKKKEKEKKIEPDEWWTLSSRWTTAVN